MAVETKVPTAAEAEADLLHHEQHIHAVHKANWERAHAERRAAEAQGSDEEQAAHRAGHEKATLAHIEANERFLAHAAKPVRVPHPNNPAEIIEVPYAKGIDILAQRVIDAREREAVKGE